MKTYHSFSSKETEKLGTALAFETIRTPLSGSKNAVIIALRGNLGSGKTTFVKGFFRGLGIKSRVKSPTFIIMRRNAIPGLRWKNGISGKPFLKSRGVVFSDVFHIDAYRLRKPKDLLALGFKAIAADPKNIILIEWPENAKSVIPHRAHRLRFLYGKKENERTIVIT